MKNKSSTVELPELTKKVFCVEAQSIDDRLISNVIDITRFSCYYHRLLRVTAHVLAIDSGSKRSLKNITMHIEVWSLQNVERLWIREAQRFLQQDFEEGKFVRLCARKNEQGIIVVGGRAIRAFESSYDVEELILLPHNHPISRLR